MNKYVVRIEIEIAVEAPSELEAVIFADLNKELGKKTLKIPDLIVVDEFPHDLQPHTFSIKG